MTICKDLLTNIVRLTERLPFVKSQIDDIFNYQSFLEIGAKKKANIFCQSYLSPRQLIYYI